jgi:hypothetical protein
MHWTNESPVPILGLDFTRQGNPANLRMQEAHMISRGPFIGVARAMRLFAQAHFACDRPILAQQATRSANQENPPITPPQEIAT